MIPWDNVTISARARITQANKRLRSLTAGGGRHGMAISRGLVVQNDAEGGEVGAGADYLSSLLLPPRGLGMRGWSRIE